MKRWEIEDAAYGGPAGSIEFDGRRYIAQEWFKGKVTQDGMSAGKFTFTSLGAAKRWFNKWCNASTRTGENKWREVQVEERATKTCMYMYAYGRCGLPTRTGTRRCIAHAERKEDA